MYKDKKLQAKHIDEMPILEFVASQSIWATVFRGFKNSITDLFSETIPDKVIIAKLRRMEKKKLIHGCFCGCRGDIVITDKGRNKLNTFKTVIKVGE